MFPKMDRPTSEPLVRAQSSTFPTHFHSIRQNGQLSLWEKIKSSNVFILKYDLYLAKIIMENKDLLSRVAQFPYILRYEYSVNC